MGSLNPRGHQTVLGSAFAGAKGEGCPETSFQVASEVETLGFKFFFCSPQGLGFGVQGLV